MNQHGNKPWRERAWLKIAIKASASRVATWRQATAALATSMASREYLGRRRRRRRNGESVINEAAWRQSMAAAIIGIENGGNINGEI
jgi:hypothetical protein